MRAHIGRAALTGKALRGVQCDRGATVRALAPALDPLTIARLALAAEVQELGIEAGPQDRVVQAHEGLLFMDFAPEHGFVHVERLDLGLLPPLFVAWLVAGSELSGGVHGALRPRVAAGEPRALALLHELGELARAGRELLHDRRGDSFGPLLDRAHDLRAALLPLRADHVAMITTCRDQGASAQYAGSGGAIVGIQPAGPAWPALRAMLEALGCETLEVDAVK